ncbi:hypothetical protein HQ487_02480 [Candidatus Uhrbacteria bacterium]|nr:hypothetical protein [Candidatus Uhrbacteria bacterium]
MNSELLYSPKANRGLLWTLRDDDKTNYPLPGYDWLLAEDDVLKAPWGDHGAQTPVTFALTLTFEGIRRTNNERSNMGCFSLVVYPKDAALIKAERERIGNSDSPRDSIKKVIIILSKMPMYPGAQLTLMGAHHGTAGTRLYLSFSATAGWGAIVSRRDAEIARHHLNHPWYDRFWNRLMRRPAVLPPEALNLDPPEDPWMEEKNRKAILALIEGKGLGGGPLRLAGESLMRKLCRDPRIEPVASNYHQTGPMTILGSRQDAPSRMPSSLTIVQM